MFRSFVGSTFLFLCSHLCSSCPPIYLMTIFGFFVPFIIEHSNSERFVSILVILWYCYPVNFLDPLFIDPYAGCFLSSVSNQKDMMQQGPITTAASPPCYYSLGTKFIDDKLISLVNSLDELRQVFFLLLEIETSLYLSFFRFLSWRGIPHLLISQNVSLYPIDCFVDRWYGHPTI